MLAVWAYWAVSLSMVTYAAATMVKRYPQYGLAALTALYVVFLGASQILAARIIVFDLGFYRFYAPSGVFVYPFVAVILDMINEVYGRKTTHMAILIALITQVSLVALILMTNTLSPAPFFKYEDAWMSIFNQSVRVTAASWASFYICSNIDAYVFAKIKQKYLGRETRFPHDTSLNPYVWLRSSVSDALDLTLDSIIFVTLAFYGETPILPLIVGQIVSKNIVGFLDNPWFVWYKRMLRNVEIHITA